MLSSTDNNFMICLFDFERFSIESRFPSFFLTHTVHSRMFFAKINKLEAYIEILNYTSPLLCSTLFSCLVLVFLLSLTYKGNMTHLHKIVGGGGGGGLEKK